MASGRGEMRSAAPAVHIRPPQQCWHCSREAPPMLPAHGQARLHGLSPAPPSTSITYIHTVPATAAAPALLPHAGEEAIARAL